MKRLGVLISLFIMLVTGSASAQFFQSGRASVAFTGDIMMHINVKRCAAVKNRVNGSGESINNGGFDYLYERIAPLFGRIDYVAGNMEFPVSPPFRQNGIIFNAPKEAIAGIRHAGIDVVSLANNHILDQNVKGAHDTMAFCEEYKLPYIGVGRSREEARRGYVREVNGIRIGMIAYTGLINYPNRNTGKGLHLNWIYNKEEVFADIRRMKQSCDYLVMQIHTGVEYVLEPRRSDREIYRACLDQGADLVIGHHPHMLQSMEMYQTKDGRNAAIFYSLGNFISDQKRTVLIRNTGRRISLRDSVVVMVELAESFGTVNDTISVIPIHTVHEYRTHDGRRYKDIQTIVIHEEIRDLDRQLDVLPKNDPRRTALASRIRFYKQRQEAISLTLFPQGKPASVRFVQ